MKTKDRNPPRHGSSSFSLKNRFNDLFFTNSVMNKTSFFNAPNPVPIQPKLSIGRSNDRYEREADNVADKVMLMEDPGVAQRTKADISIWRKCDKCETEDKIHRKESDAESINTVPSSVYSTLNSAGQPLENSTRNFMEPRFGSDFSHVRVHANSQAADSAHAINAKAYTSGKDIVFGEGQYRPQSDSGNRLIAHELTHVLQQGNNSPGQNSIQRADLSSPRMAGNALFEDVLDNREVIELGDSGQEVRRIQQMLIDLGFGFTSHSANGVFDAETQAAVEAFQTSVGFTGGAVDGRVGFRTIGELDRAFPAVTLPANRAAPWTMPCILQILCPWNQNLVENVLPTFNIVTFDSRSFPVETWDGSNWNTSTFQSGGFRGGTNMGFLNTVSCQEMAFVIYHEGWHGQQPATMSGVVEVEKDAYINAEQWSIDIGVPGQGTFTNEATGATESFRAASGGETVVNEAAAETFVRQEYGGVSSIPGERILSRVGASDVRVRRPNGTEYTRPAAVGESVRGTTTMTNLNPIDPADWACP
jgi:hypothetical protein